MPAVSRSGAVPTSLDAIFAALAHPTRRAILRRLRRGPASVGALIEPFGVTQQAISRHIAVLQKAGLIHQRKRGRESRCVLRTRPLKEADKWIEIYRPLWEERFTKLAAYLESAGGRSSPGRSE
jgi:DNA-binding transcriptional ArsR family regulator